MLINDGFFILWNRNYIGNLIIQCILVYFFLVYQVVVDCFEVDSYDFCFWQGEVYVQEIFFVYDNWVKVDDVGVVGVEDYYVWVQFQQVGCNVIVLDSIFYQLQCFFLWMVKYYVVGFVQVFSYCWYCVGLVVVVLVGGGFLQVYVGKFVVC